MAELWKRPLKVIHFELYNQQKSYDGCELEMDIRTSKVKITGGSLFNEGFVLRITIRVYKEKVTVASFIAEIEYQTNDYNNLELEQLCKTLAGSIKDAAIEFRSRLQKSIPDYYPEIDHNLRVSDQELINIAKSLLS